MNMLGPLMARSPKAKPLARTLVKAAAEQGVTMEEFDLACRLACEAFRRALDRSGIVLSEFECEAKAALDGI